MENVTKLAWSLSRLSGTYNIDKKEEYTYIDPLPGLNLNGANCPFKAAAKWVSENKGLYAEIVEAIRKLWKRRDPKPLVYTTADDIVEQMQGYPTWQSYINEHTTYVGNTYNSYFKLEDALKIEDEQVQKLFISVLIHNYWYEVTNSNNVYYPKVIDINIEHIVIDIDNDKIGLFIGKKGRSIKYIEKIFEKKIVIKGQR